MKSWISFSLYESVAVFSDWLCSHDIAEVKIQLQTLQDKSFPHSCLSGYFSVEKHIFCWVLMPLSPWPKVLTILSKVDLVLSVRKSLQVKQLCHIEMLKFLYLVGLSIDKSIDWMKYALCKVLIDIFSFLIYRNRSGCLGSRACVRDLQEGCMFLKLLFWPAALPLFSAMRSIGMRHFAKRGGSKSV